MSHAPLGSVDGARGAVPPPQEFVARSRYADPGVYDEAEADWVGWWEHQAHALAWTRPWDEPLAWDPPFARWFVGGRLNASVSCLDRHVEAGHGGQVAYHWVGEPGDRRDLTYAELAKQVGRLANALRGLGVARGDRVAIYLPMVPELVVAMLACARIGAPHSVVYAGFGAQALADRLVDAEAKVLITADGAHRRGEVLPLKRVADVAMGAAESVRACLVVRRTNSDVRLMPGRDAWYDEVVGQASPTCEPEAMDAEDPLFLLYTSGTTGTPKGIVHRTGGYLTHVAATHRMVFDHDPDRDVFWCAVNFGWITGHSYGVYGPLANRATSVLAEGALDHPSPDRAWRIAELDGVTTLYTTPAIIRAFRAAGEDRPAAHDLSSLRLLGSVGEPIEPEVWRWYHEAVGGGRCPIVDTWWQAETGGMMLSPLPAITEAKPGSAMRPLPGIEASVVDDEGAAVERGQAGHLTVPRPWPGMLQTIWGDDERYRRTYWSRFGDEVYATGDRARVDDDGDLWLLGRDDEVLKVAGHRLSSAELEAAIVDHRAVAEAAVAGRADPLVGHAIVAFVRLRPGYDADPARVAQLREHVAARFGAIARPETIVVVDDLPKTRAGTIMRRLLEDLAEGRAPGDTSALDDPDLVAHLVEATAEATGRR